MMVKRWSLLTLCFGLLVVGSVVVFVLGGCGGGGKGQSTVERWTANPRITGTINGVAVSGRGVAQYENRPDLGRSLFTATWDLDSGMTNTLASLAFRPFPLPPITIINTWKCTPKPGLRLLDLVGTGHINRDVRYHVIGSDGVDTPLGRLVFDGDITGDGNTLTGTFTVNGDVQDLRRYNLRADFADINTQPFAYVQTLSSVAPGQVQGTMRMELPLADGGRLIAEAVTQYRSSSPEGRPTLSTPIYSVIQVNRMTFPPTSGQQFVLEAEGFYTDSAGLDEYFVNWQHHLFRP